MLHAHRLLALALASSVSLALPLHAADGAPWGNGHASFAFNEATDETVLTDTGRDLSRNARTEW